MRLACPLIPLRAFPHSIRFCFRFASVSSRTPPPAPLYCSPLSACRHFPVRHFPDNSFPTYPSCASLAHGQLLHPCTVPLCPPADCSLRTLRWIWTDTDETLLSRCASNLGQKVIELAEEVLFVFEKRLNLDIDLLRTRGMSASICGGTR